MIDQLMQQAFSQLMIALTDLEIATAVDTVQALQRLKRALVE
jgi:hypothetical protein